MIITKTLFYFGIANQIVPNLTIKNTKFYTKRTSHPHPLVRALNIMECFIENINNDFPHLKVDEQALLNNTMSIMKLYFNRLTPGQNAINNLFEELFSNIELINAYNGELNECARKNDVIRGILTSRYIQFK